MKSRSVEESALSELEVAKNLKERLKSKLREYKLRLETFVEKYEDLKKVITKMAWVSFTVLIISFLNLNFKENKGLNEKISTLEDEKKNHSQQVGNYPIIPLKEFLIVFQSLQSPMILENCAEKT